MHSKILRVAGIIISIAIVQTTQAGEDCARKLVETKPGALLAQEILAARAKYRQQSQREMARLWNQAGGEWRFLTANAPPPAGEQHVIYFSSAHDVFRMLADFPLAHHYHLVDHGLPYLENVAQEVSSRLKALAPDARVIVEDTGYAEGYTLEMLEKYRGPSAHRSMELSPEPIKGILRPMILKVTWASAYLGPQEKRIYLHPFSYSSPMNIYAKPGTKEREPGDPVNLEDYEFQRATEGEVALLLATIPDSHRLIGVMQIGGSSLFAEDLIRLAQRLDDQGFLVFEKTPGQKIEIPQVAMSREEVSLREIEGLKVIYLPGYRSDADEAAPRRQVPYVVRKTPTREK